MEFVWLVLLVLFAFLVVSQVVGKLSKGVSSSRSVVLLAGIGNSGKTSLYHRLRKGEWMTTVTSMKEKSDTFPLSYDPTSTISVLDYPGHPRLRFQLPDFYPIIEKIVFLIDAADKDAIRPSAEYLFDLLTCLDVPLLIVCNKSDLVDSKIEAKTVQTRLERELTQLKITRASLETEGDDEQENMPLGRPGQAFDFATDCQDCTFTMASCKKDQVEGIIDFLTR